MQGGSARWTHVFTKLVNVRTHLRRSAYRDMIQPWRGRSEILHQSTRSPAAVVIASEQQYPRIVILRAHEFAQSKAVERLSVVLLRRRRDKQTYLHLLIKELISAANRASVRVRLNGARPRGRKVFVMKRRLIALCEGKTVLFTRQTRHA